MKAYVVLEDGTVFSGKSFGSTGEALGEVVFNTSITGYQEILTDPSYKKQIVLMTYPQIGNYGINEDDMESSAVHVEGFIVKEACAYPSNHTSVISLPDYLKEHGIIAIESVDTRALTRHIRHAGSMKAVIYAGDDKPDFAALTHRAATWEGTENIDTVKDVTCREEYVFKAELGRKVSCEQKYSVVAIDFGVKNNILRILTALGCEVTVVPATTTAEEILAKNPDGVFLSNGPGDPAAVTYAIETIRALIGKVPLYGICLGHQLLTLALGGETYKLKFGHHGGNQPVKNLSTSKVEITAQNHCFCADMCSLEGKVEMTHVNLNDQTCEGMADWERSFFSVQYHPEAGPGPHDSLYLFKTFIDLMAAWKSENN